MLGSTVFDRSLKVAIPVITLECYERMVSLADSGRAIPYFNRELLPINNREFVKSYRIPSKYQTLFHYFENEYSNFIYDFGNDPAHEIDFSIETTHLIINPRIFLDQKGYITCLIINYEKKLDSHFAWTVNNSSEDKVSISIKIPFYKGKQILDIKSFMSEHIASIPDLAELEFYTSLYEESSNIKIN